MKQAVTTSTLIHNALGTAFDNLTEKFRDALQSEHVYYDDYDEELEELSAYYSEALDTDQDSENANEARKAFYAKQVLDEEGHSMDFEFRSHIEYAVYNAIHAATETFREYFSSKLDRFTNELMSYVDKATPVLN